jgi:thiol-disulfide isomerase/thioredoxin
MSRDDSNFYDGSKYVLELNESDFDPTHPTHLKSKRCSAVLFYGAWCPYCRQVKDEWEAFGKMDLTREVLALNCEKHKEQLEKFRTEDMIPSFPTIVFYRDGVPIETFREERTKQNFLKASIRVCK